MDELAVAPAHEVPWGDIEALFGANGACGGCWCMVWRRTRKAFELGKGEGNRQALHALWQSGQPFGLVGHVQGRAAAWVSVAPREAFVYFQTSRVLRPAPGEAGVWSISCLFVAKPWRRQGLAVRMIAAARDWAQSQGAAWVEGYPVSPRSPAAAPVFLWTGTPRAFEAAGFRRHPNPSGERAIYRSP